MKVPCGPHVTRTPNISQAKYKVYVEEINSVDGAIQETLINKSSNNRFELCNERLISFTIDLKNTIVM